ncbi:cingulin-like protein 1 [Fundulus heteroclitus]|uniref:cingulin-like protein 1 n=1 Tax=Fundulus heteroclitus TaxID=8078 RepID=UPI00165B7372|nr:cingulin-like protein 1 [Fundulus heteroclitus]
MCASGPLRAALARKGEAAPPTTRPLLSAPDRSLSFRSRAAQKPSSKQTPDFQRNEEELPVSVDKLRQLIEDKVNILWLPTAENQQGLVLEENPGGEEELFQIAALSQELNVHLQQLQRRTEQELRNIQAQLSQIEGRLQQLSAELSELQQRKKRAEEELKTTSCPQTTAFRLCAHQKLQVSITERLVQSEQLLFQEQALSALRNLLTQDLHRYQEETRKLARFTEKISGKKAQRSDGEEKFGCSEQQSMQDKNETELEKNMESELDLNKQSDSPSEEEPSTPRATTVTQSPKYQLMINNELKTNGLSSREANGPGGGESSPRLPRWEATRLGANNFRGSLESLASRDWDTGSDRAGLIDSPPRAFNSPYTTSSLEYNPSYRVTEFKGRLSPANSEMNLYGFNSRSTSPIGVPSATLTAPRARFSTYDTLRRKPEINNPVAPIHYSMRSNTLGAPNKRNYVEELTKQLDSCQKRNAFLEAEMVEMEKERNQIRFEMRALIVSKEDLLRNNAQLNNELKKTREQMIEIDRETQALRERCREMEIEVKQARDVMVEANTQEYAFNFLQQSLKNKIQDAEDNLEKQSQHAQSLAEKLWLAERELEDMKVTKETHDKKTSDLNSTILRLEEELSEALKMSTQNSAELSLQQKLRQDAQDRVEELEESLLEKDQECQRLSQTVEKLNAEVTGKLIDKERSLEDEIQLRERLQLQCRQAERTVDDLSLELQTTNQVKEDLIKQLKLSQEKVLDLESELEELQDSEQRWAAKQKRAIEQTEQLQLKLIQEKELNEQLETEKAFMERQLRELRLEVEDLQSSRVQEDVVSRAETRAKELENALRAEERNKATLTNTISKLERKINELSDQLEEEHRIATEQKDLMTQRIRTLKRQLNEAEEEGTRKEAQYRHVQRELTEERETNSRLQRQLLDQHLQTKRKENLTIRQTLDNLRLDLSVDEEDDGQLLNEQPTNVTKV